MHSDKRVAIGRIGHDTHIQLEFVAGGEGANVESDLQRIQRIHIRVDRRQDGNLVVIRASRGVGVETDGVAAGSGIRCAGIDHRVSGIGSAGAFVDVAPAVRQVVDRYRSGGGAAVGIEILHERQGGHVGTCRARRYLCVAAVFAATAYRTQTDIV